MTAAPQPYALDWQAVEYYRTRPVEFVEDQIDAEPDAYQKRILQALADGKWPVVPAGRGVGKTAVLAWIVIWWLYTHPTAKIPVTSVKREQLLDNLWPEVSKWLEKSKVANDLVWQKTKVFMRGAEETAFAVARTGASVEALQGFHDDNLLILVEEASGVGDEVVDGLLGSLTQAGNIVAMFGNPTKTSGAFHHAFTHPAGRQEVVRIPCLDDKGNLHPHVTQEWVDFMRMRYGEDSPQFRIYVRGLPPAADADTVISYGLVVDACLREVPPQLDYRPIWGLDVARFGDDSSALAKRRGNVLSEPISQWRNKDTMQLAAIVYDDYMQTPDKDRPSEIYVDSLNMGAGVVDRLRQLGAPAIGINVAERPSSKDKYPRLRDELWFRASEWFQGRACHIPYNPDTRDGNDFLDQLTTIKYAIQPDGKNKVEAKADFKRRLPGIGSPDLADAFCLTFAGGDTRYELIAPPPSDYRRREVRSTSWMAI